MTNNVCSMTAYASCQQDFTNFGQVSCEIKSVNSRFLDLSIRLPDYLSQLESALRKSVSQKLKRGKVELSLYIKLDQEFKAGKLYKDQISDYLNLYKYIKQAICSTDKIEVQGLAISDLIKNLTSTSQYSQNKIILDNLVSQDFVQELQSSIVNLVEQGLAKLLAERQREGSVLISFGDTKVICTASFQKDSVPRFLKNSGQGWITAEYGMLPRSTHSRMDREAARGKQSGRTQEIQRLIGRSLRACVDLNLLGEHTIIIDCDVIQADGGTRTAAITGGCVALMMAIKSMLDNKTIKKDPVIKTVSAISVGLYKDQAILDLDYKEDSNAEMDMNLVIDNSGQLIEIQGTAEGYKSIPMQMLPDLIALAEKGTEELAAIQKEVLG